MSWRSALPPDRLCGRPCFALWPKMTYQLKGQPPQFQGVEQPCWVYDTERHGVDLPASCSEKNKVVRGFGVEGTLTLAFYTARVGDRKKGPKSSSQSSILPWVQSTYIKNEDGKQEEEKERQGEGEGRTQGGWELFLPQFQRFCPLSPSGLSTQAVVNQECVQSAWSPQGTSDQWLFRMPS